MNKVNNVRYIERANRVFTIKSISKFRNWVDFKTEQGNTVSTLYNEVSGDLKVGDEILASSVIDTQWNRARIVTILRINGVYQAKKA